MVHIIILLMGIGIGLKQYKDTGEWGYTIATIAITIFVLIGATLHEQTCSHDLFNCALDKEEF